MQAPLLALAGAVVAGALSGLFGFGGPALLSPYFVLVLGLSQHEAQGLSLAALLPPVALPAVLAYRRAGVVVPWRMVGALVLGFLLGAGAGGALAQLVPGRALRLSFAGFLVFAGLRALLAARASTVSVEPPAPPDAFRPKAFAVGLLGGVASGLLGIGGGLIVTPLLRRWVGLPRLQAQAATLAMMLPPIGAPAVVAYVVSQGGLPWVVLGAVALGFALGSAVGGRVAPGITPRVVNVSYGLVALLTAGLLAARA